MVIDDLGEVETIHVVGAQDDDHVWLELMQERELLGDGVCVALGEPVGPLPLERWQDLQPPVRAVEIPRTTVGQVIVEGVG